MKPSLYQSVLGPSFTDLAAPLQAFHAPQLAPIHYEGWVSIWQGRAGWLKALAWVMGLPKPCLRGRCEVRLQQTAQGHEVWHRQMNGRAMVSQQSAAPHAGKLLEAAFPYTITLENRVSRGALWQRSVNGRVLGIPLPNALQMRVVAIERTVSDTEFAFDVRLYLPGFRRLLPFLHYRGQLRIAR